MRRVRLWSPALAGSPQRSGVGQYRVMLDNQAGRRTSSAAERCECGWVEYHLVPLHLQGPRSEAEWGSAGCDSTAMRTAGLQERLNNVFTPYLHPW